MIPLSLLKLPDELYKLYGAIRSFDWEKDDEERAGCTAEVETLAEMIGKGRTQTWEGLRALEACGAIHRERRGHLPSRLVCTPEAFDPAKIPPPRPKKLNPGKPKSPELREAEVTTPGSRRDDFGIPKIAPNSELETIKQTHQVEVAPLVLAMREAGPKRKAKAVSPEMPPWLPVDRWAAWERFRRAGKAPWTPDAVETSLRKLAALREQGHDPAEVIDQSIAAGWTTFWPVKEPQVRRDTKPDNRPASPPRGTQNRPTWKAPQ